VTVTIARTRHNDDDTGLSDSEDAVEEDLDDDIDSMYDNDSFLTT